MIDSISDIEKTEDAVGITSGFIALYLVCLVVDILYCAYVKNGYYSFSDTVNSMHLSQLSRSVGFYWRFLSTVPYKWVHTHLRIVDLPSDKWWQILLAVLFVDFGYYWHHRIAHKINAFWGGHKAHHSSEEFNFATALRQGAFESMFSFLAYLPMALIFSHKVYVTFIALNLTWQFFVHTRHINKMPAWFEFIFNTPSHHRVHHGCNPIYIDKNYAGFLVIWDRMFGTFQEEVEEVVFGDTHPLRSWNPLYATVQHFIIVYKRLIQFPNESIWAKLQILYKGPGWSPKNQTYYPVPPVDAKTFRRYRPPLTLPLQCYIALQYLPITFFTLQVIEIAPRLYLWELMPFSIFSALSLVALGKLMECNSDLDVESSSSSSSSEPVKKPPTGPVTIFDYRLPYWTLEPVRLALALITSAALYTKRIQFKPYAGFLTPTALICYMIAFALSLAALPFLYRWERIVYPTPQPSLVHVPSQAELAAGADNKKAN